jgi:hypothetical protein
MWNPVLTISPLAKGVHRHVATYPHYHDLTLDAVVTPRSFASSPPIFFAAASPPPPCESHPCFHASCQDPHSQHAVLFFRILTKPSFGTLAKHETEEPTSRRFRYTPNKDFTGSDFFTFVASNNVRPSHPSLDPNPNPNPAIRTRNRFFSPQTHSLSRAFRNLPKTERGPRNLT